GLMPAMAVAQTAEPKPTPPAEAPKPAEEAQPACSDCHDEAKVFITNPHARGSVKNNQVPNDVCSTCHGDGTEHAAAGGDKSKISIPRGRKGTDETCMMCHDVTTERISRHAGMHANSEAVNCLSCHSIHHPDVRSPHLVAKPQLQLCSTCHTQTAGFMNKPYTHRLGRGGMQCSSCHEPHGRPSESTRSLTLNNTLRNTATGVEAPCLGCHADKRGPFVFSHGGNQVGDCTNCHEPHGSSNPKMLRRATVWQLCVECHSPITNTLGSQPPSFHNLNDPRYRNCTTCHVAVHGSNRDPQLLRY
ncbi:MAG TPA: DmsE family decaheme c-type cytochrome, partial [Thermoanaerobaculia bacterium]|nr:DmsE family decaheme c-type cytochrome [Thermoanaerobaculia bacterium]